VNPWVTFPWVEEWLNSSTCSPPCWEGITPGESTLYQITDDTVNINNKLYLEGPLPYSDGSFYFDWKYKYNDIIFPAVTATTESNLDMTIGELRFYLGEPESMIDLKDIITHMGAPDLIGVYTVGPIISCKFVLLYPEKNVWLELGGNQIKDRILIDKSSTLSWSYYLSDTKWEKRMEAFLPNQNQVYTWNGYMEYSGCK
jgi:hypothetical protein